MIVVEKTRRFTLALTGTTYTFEPMADGQVMIDYHGRYERTYALPADEARQLWRRLVAKGYTRW